MRLRTSKTITEFRKIYGVFRLACSDRLRRRSGHKVSRVVFAVRRFQPTRYRNPADEPAAGESPRKHSTGRLPPRGRRGLSPPRRSSQMVLQSLRRLRHAASREQRVVGVVILNRCRDAELVTILTERDGVYGFGDRSEGPIRVVAEEEIVRAVSLSFLPIPVPYARSARAETGGFGESAVGLVQLHGTDVANDRARLAIHNRDGDIPDAGNVRSAAAAMGSSLWCVKLLSEGRSCGDRGKSENTEQIRFH